MVNRTLLRIKTVQIVYSFYQNGGNNISTCEKELLFSIQKSHELYYYLLYLSVQLTDMAKKRIEAGKNKLLPTYEELHPNTKFIDNRFVAQLAQNTQLLQYVDERKIGWDENFLKTMYNTITSSELYETYMRKPTSDYDEDKDIWKKLYKKLILNNEDLNVLLEEESLYWNDDIAIVGTFVLKTIKQFDPENGADQLLQPMFKDEEDRYYVCRLVRTAIANGEEFKTWINEHIRNWDFDRIALMDIVIMQVALAELLEFSTIPINVTMNEYLEIAKAYSTEKSSIFINGILDTILIKLKNEGKLEKIPLA